MMAAQSLPHWLYFGLFPTLHYCLHFFGVDFDKRESSGREEGEVKYKPSTT